MMNREGMPDFSLTSQSPLLIVIIGPTAVGKTALSIELARRLQTEILSADSRQFYREMRIGTAVPSDYQRSLVTHHLIGHISINEPYDVYRYEQDAIRLLDSVFLHHPVVIMTGGSGLYVQAVLKGIDELPDPDPDLRLKLKEEYAREGLLPLQRQLSLLDPEYYEQVDKNNPKRLIRALEVCLTTGMKFSQLRRNQPAKRPFRSILIGLDMERDRLYNRINQRVDQMFQEGLLEEARALVPYRHLNALNTVGYKELFAFFDGEISFEQAVRDIKTHTRKYAKRQLTWFRKDPEIHWFDPENLKGIWDYIQQCIESIG